MCRLLVEHGARVLDANGDGQNAFYIACREGQLHLLDLLLELDAGAAATPLADPQSKSPQPQPESEPTQTFAATRPCMVRSWSVLLNSRTMNHKTPLHGAAVNGQVRYSWARAPCAGFAPDPCTQ